MIKPLTFLLVATCWSGTSLAQLANRAASPAHAAYLDFTSTSQTYALDAAPQALAKELALTSADAFVRVRTGHDQAGGVHERYAQYYRNVPVEGALYLVHARQGRIESINGHYERIKDLSVVPAITEGAALTLALQNVGAQRYSWQLPTSKTLPLQRAASSALGAPPKGELLIVSDATADLAVDQPTLAWKFNVCAAQPQSLYYLYVDAQSGKVLGRVNQVHDLVSTAITRPASPAVATSQSKQSTSSLALSPSASFAGTAETFHHGIRQIMTDLDKKTGAYILHDYDKGASGEWNIRTIFNDQANFSFIDFLDTDNYWEQSPTPLIYAATDIHFGTHMTDDFFRTRYGRNSYDNNGGAVLNVLPYDNQPGGARVFLAPTQGTGTTVPGTSTPFQGLQINYGPGIDAAHPMASIDVVAHEYGHGINVFAAQLGDTGEPGSLNEGFSDIWGACLTAYIGEQPLMWRFMERVATPGTARVMDTPKANGFPDTYLSPLGYNVNADPHDNATIISHWFYLLSEGGAGVNDVGFKYRVKGIGWEKAADILYLTETSYLVPTSSFCQTFDPTLGAAAMLYGYPSPEYQAVYDAWRAVNVCAALRPGMKEQASGEQLGMSGLYPNPAANTATIALSEAPATPVEASIYNDKGRVVKVISLEKVSTTVDLQELQPGLYYLRYEEHGKAQSQTFRIER